MGIDNRQRRRAKQHKRQQRQRRRESVGADPEARSGDRGRLHDEEVVRGAVLAACEAFRSGPDALYRARLDRLAALHDAVGRPLVDGAVAWWAALGLDRAWCSGWQPADVDRALRRTLGQAHADAMRPLVAESGARAPEAGVDDRWASQVEGLRAGAAPSAGRQATLELGVAVEAVSLLLHLPPLPDLAPAPDRARRPGRGASSTVLERVRALLAKAESTTFPEEAEALTAKAQELMARHAIDQAMLDADRGGGRAGVVGWRIGIDDPYAAAKSFLLDRIAAANRCRAVWSKHLGFSTVFGTRSDLEMVELLFTSLLVQGTDAMLRAGRRVDRSGRSRTRSFRQSFLLAYATRISERLAATTAGVVADATARHGAALLPVLAGRAEAVDDAVSAAYPGLVERGMAVNNHAGWAAGRAAAEVASLSVGDALPSG